MPKIMKSLTTKIMSNEMVKYMSEHPEEAVKSFGLKELFKNEYNNIDESKESVESDESIVTE
jgi:flavoprotein